MCKLHHVAIAVVEFEQYVELFEKLGMKVEKRTGEVPYRQLWFAGGIQLKEIYEAEEGNLVDHIALGVKDIEETIKIALKNGCCPLEKGDNWFALPNGIIIELLEE